MVTYNIIVWTLSMIIFVGWKDTFIPLFFTKKVGTIQGEKVD